MILKILTSAVLKKAAFLLIFPVIPVFGFQTDEKVYRPEHFTTYEGVEIFRPSQWNKDRYLRIVSGAAEHTVSRHYYGPSAKYDVELTGVKIGETEELTVKLMINSREAGTFQFQSETGAAEGESGRRVKRLEGIDIPRYSEITLLLTGGDKTGWMIGQLALIPGGEYTGTPDSPEKPQHLRVYNRLEEQRAAHSMLERFTDRKLAERLAKRDSLLSTFDSPGQWQSRQNEIRENLASVLGSFPDKKTPLNPRIMGEIEYEDYKIEKVIYESQPEFYVPANLYIPKNRELPLPAVLYTIGHWDSGKMAEDIHKICAGLAKKGYVVIAVDPLGQGERSEYYDPETLEPTVGLGVEQHHYINRPAMLAGRTFAGLRVWDYIRAVDYLVSRPEVDTTRIASAGNSGGGQMALVAAAADDRIKVVAAAHPGGSCERAYLTGRELPSHQLLSLVAPRPVRMIVGNESGEAGHHMRKLEDMGRFYRGLGAGDERWEMDVTGGRHDNSKPIRESTYEWLNRWFHKTEEGKEEPPLETEDEAMLRSTQNGVVLASLGGESGRTINREHAEELYRPEKDLAVLKQKVAQRLHLHLPERESSPDVRLEESFTRDDLFVEKFAYTSEEGIEVPALLIRPAGQPEKDRLIVHVSAKGKPERFDDNTLPFRLVRAGYPVLTIDVRGTGETSPHPPAGEPGRYTGYTAEMWTMDLAGLEAGSYGRTLTGMQALDLIRGIRLMTQRTDLEEKSVIIAGEGPGGLWALLGTIYSPGVDAVITINTLPSYRMLISGKYYDQQGYFYVPGALNDYDIPDLVRLVSPKRQLWIDPVNEVSKRMDKKAVLDYLGKPEGLGVVSTAQGEGDELLQRIVEFIDE